MMLNVYAKFAGSIRKYAFLINLYNFQLHILCNFLSPKFHLVRSTFIPALLCFDTHAIFVPHIHPLLLALIFLWPAIVIRRRVCIYLWALTNFSNRYTFSIITHFVMVIMANRLLTAGLQSTQCVIWAEALNFEHVLSRILWVSENTLNPQLIEKV